MDRQLKNGSSLSVEADLEADLAGSWFGMFVGG